MTTRSDLSRNRVPLPDGWHDWGIWQVVTVHTTDGEEWAGLHEDGARDCVGLRHARLWRPRFSVPEMFIHIGNDDPPFRWTDKPGEAFRKMSIPLLRVRFIEHHDINGTWWNLRCLGSVVEAG